MKESPEKSLCVIHHDRAASARCPACRQFFCSECVTEHSGKFICSSCLTAASVSHRSVKKKSSVFHPALFLQLVMAAALCWTVFYLVAKFLGGVPDEFHDGTIWE